MERLQQMVLQFHQAKDCAWQQRPGPLPWAHAALRLVLIREEYEELVQAAMDNNLEGIADALADLLYVVMGAGLAWGIDLEPVFIEVHRSNMTKAGGQRRTQRKVLKGPQYRPPRIRAILDILRQRSIGRNEANTGLRPSSWTAEDLEPIE